MRMRACVRACARGPISRRARGLSLVASLGQRFFKSTVRRFPALRVGDWHRTAVYAPSGISYLSPLPCGTEGTPADRPSASPFVFFFKSNHQLPSKQ